MQSPSSCPSTKNGFKEGINYITSQLPQRSLTKQALKRLASALKKKSPPSSPQKSGVGSVSSQQASSTQKPKKKVTFYGMVQVRATIGLHELSLQERSATWYHKYEYFIFSSECARLVQRMRRGKTIECSRGLEYRTRKDINRRSVVDIVLDEQDRQALLGIVDDEHIAFLYHSVSSCSNRWSSLVGLQDQKEAGIANQCDESQMPAFAACQTKKEHL
eukprot:Nitzschia sp. Nitz4//scaffold26_size159584//60478//61148//NITZ4_002485-RA/size159584-snap-gene-0.16-mRNA-1//1//CDS//3329545064//6796//frame0